MKAIFIITQRTKKKSSKDFAILPSNTEVHSKSLAHVRLSDKQSASSPQDH